MRKLTINDFNKRINKDAFSDCIIYSGPKYGNYFSFGRDYAHRFIYKHHFGNINDNFEILHSCDNPACVNINHLSLGTHQDNMRDRNNKGRTAKGEKNGTSKLNTNQIIEIRQKYNKGLSSIKLSKEYKVSFKHILRIVNKERWAHI